jgi:acetyl-CoA C-acetyltransferase
VIPRKVGIVGVGYANFGLAYKETREESQLAFTAVKRALDMANISVADIDATVYCIADAFQGTNRLLRTIDAFGQSYNKPAVHVFTGGSAGIATMKVGYQYIASGLYDIVLLYGGNDFSSVVDGQQILNTASPPLFEKFFGVGALHMGAFHAASYMRKYGATEEDLALAASKSYALGAKNPYAHIRKPYSVEEILASPMMAWPLRQRECCPLSSGGTAIVMAFEERARELTDTPVWIRAIGSIADTWLSGYREYGKFSNLKILAERLYKEAGIKNPREEIDVAELFNVFSSHELLQYEAFGFCEEGKAVSLLREGATSEGGDIPVNMSGGMLCTNAGVASQLGRPAELALQLMGKFEGVQVRSPEVGLAHNCGGNLWQFHAAVILNR